MTNKLSAKVGIHIGAPVDAVWKALTDPDMIRSYLFGTIASSDFKKGSPITYSGEWQGKSYLDKGVIVEAIPGQLLHTTYFSSMSGKEDRPENYANVIYELHPETGGTYLNLTQDNIENDEGVEHMKSNWTMVLGSMKKLLENGSAPA
jgi:uncharacterized protein YndB with AHSA1/START domain